MVRNPDRTEPTRTAASGRRAVSSGARSPHLLSGPATYPVLATGTHLHLSPTGCWLLYEVSDSPHWNWGLTRISHDEASIILACDGQTSLADLAARFQPDGACAENTVASFLEAMAFKGILSFSTHPHPSPAFPSVGGSRDFQVPLHVFLELTDRCNQVCRHCYRDSRPDAGTFAPTELVLQAVEDLAQHGTLVCEITGGEPTIHPDFERIVAACAHHFELISIISNGVLVDGNLASLLSDLRSDTMILVSITLNSHDASFHDSFVGRVGSPAAACEAIALLSSANILVRATMNVVPENLSHLEKTAELALDLGAEAFAPAFVMPFGRASSIDWSNVSVEAIERYERTYARLKKKYPLNIVTLPETAFDVIEAPNCGAGSRSIVVSPLGDIRPCVTIPPDIRLGNIFLEPLETCLNNPLALELESLPAPSTATCGSCEYAGFCNRCFWRGLVAREATKACPWFEDHVRGCLPALHIPPEYREGVRHMLPVPPSM